MSYERYADFTQVNGATVNAAYDETASLREQLAEAQAKLAAAERDAVGLLKAEYYRGYSDREQEVRDGIGAYGHPIEAIMDDLRPGNVYYTPPTATALVEDFKRRVKKALVNANESSLLKTDENWAAFDKFTSDSIAAIDSLPLIQG